MHDTDDEHLLDRLARFNGIPSHVIVGWACRELVERHGHRCIDGVEVYAAATSLAYGWNLSMEKFIAQAVNDLIHQEALLMMAPLSNKIH